MIDNTTHDATRRFGGVERLYGKNALNNFKKAHVIVIGIGGVGSWAVEALARNAMGKLTLIDMDVVAESNINRQLPAMTSTLGRNKIDVMAERINEINPDCNVTLIDDFLTRDNLAEMIGDGIDNRPDYVIDCIDNSKVKAALIAWCKRRKIKIITLGGAGGQTDPSLIKISDLSKTMHDPLLSKTRKLLRQKYSFSKEGKRRFSVPCVFSSEHLKYVTLSGEMSNNKPAASSELTDLSCAGGIGSSVMVTASFAFIATSYVLEKIAQK
ncbi:MAG: tRNA cyclic N6-threonylcarbamoyladenosine(37) synthase TcdA [Cocleimonas sp.]